VPDPNDYDEPEERAAVERALRYMALEPGTPMQEIQLDRVFIGSCTNARIEDLRVAASVVAGKRGHPSVRALAVPGSATVRPPAGRGGWAGFSGGAGGEGGRAGSRVCRGMTRDFVPRGARGAAEPTRSSGGRRGPGGGPLVLGPPMAAAAALAGHIVDVRELE